jgi:apolipoprotein N-acyltransferase
MAILRGVENGFSEVRAARQGRLTITDCFGRVNAEAAAIHKKNISLISEVTLLKKNTFYSRFGNWFGIVNLVAAIGLIFLSRRSRGSR